MSILGQLLPNGKFQVNATTGLPLVGGKLFSYAATTTTPKATYTDATLATPNANPVILDSSGAASIWIDNTGYKLILQDAAGNVLWTQDQVYLVSPGSIAAAQIADHSITPLQLNLSTLVSADLPNALIGTSNIKTGAVTGGTGGTIALGTLEANNLDQAVDLTGLTKMTEVIFTQPPANGNGKITATPQYKWTAPVLMTNPGTTPTGSAGASKWSPDNNFLAVAHTTTPFISIYQRTGTTITKVPTPGLLPAGNANAVAWSPDGTLLAVAHITTPFITIYRRNGANFEKLADPRVLPAGDAFGVSFSPDGSLLSITHKSAPGLTVYQVQRSNLEGFQSGGVIYRLNISAGTAVNGDTYGPGGGTFFTIIYTFLGNIAVVANTGAFPGTSGTYSRISGSGAGTLTWTDLQNVSLDSDVISFVKLADPGTLPGLGGAGTATSPSWSPDGTMLAIGSPVTPFVYVYQISGTTPTLTYLTAPVSLPPGSVLSTAWSPDQQFLAVGSATSTFLTLYQVSGTTLTTISAPASMPSAQVTGVAFSPNGSLLAIAYQSSPYMIVYQISGTTFTAMAAPINLVGSNSNDISWAPTGGYLALAVTSTPYVNFYQSGTSTFPTNALLWVRALRNV